MEFIVPEFRQSMLRPSALNEEKPAPFIRMERRQWTNTRREDPSEHLWLKGSGSLTAQWASSFEVSMVNFWASPDVSRSCKLSHPLLPPFLCLPRAGLSSKTAMLLLASGLAAGRVRPAWRQDPKPEAGWAIQQDLFSK